MESGQEVLDRLHELENELRIVVDSTNMISKCAVDMYNKISGEIVPAYEVLQANWCGSTAVSYLEKTSKTINEIVEDCRTIHEGAAETLDNYLGYVEQEIIKLGLNPHDVLPEIF